MIIGHNKQWQFLKRSAETGRLSHAYLFSGQEKLGKKKMAFEWISLLFGNDLKKSGHPDLTLIEPEGKEIKIDQIKGLIRSLYLKPHSAPLKAAIIDKAHSMNPEAQTSLLKTLEEPRGETVLILIAEEPDRLLPTILSRVQTVKFYPVQGKEIKSYLAKQGISEKESENLISNSFGGPGRMIDFLFDSEKLDKAKERINDLEKIMKGDLGFRFEYAKELSGGDPKGQKETLDVWISYLREALISKVNGGKSNIQYSILKLKNVLSRIQYVERLISNTNVNSRLALESLMLEI
ncbi:MAG: DNA polymerase III subunit [Candidatus Nealsonbacteria bacterium]